MPYKKIGKKYEFKGTEYDTETEAVKAYQAYLDAAMGVKSEKPKPAKKKAASKVDDDDDLLSFGHD